MAIKYIEQLIEGLSHPKRPVRFVSALVLTIVVFLGGNYACGQGWCLWGDDDSNWIPRLDIPADWLPAFSGFSSDGERHFFICDVGMKSLADLSVDRVATIGSQRIKLNPMSPEEQRAVQARLERSCMIIDKYRKS